MNPLRLVNVPLRQFCIQMAASIHDKPEPEAILNTAKQILEFCEDAVERGEPYRDIAVTHDNHPTIQ